MADKFVASSGPRQANQTQSCGSIERGLSSLRYSAGSVLTYP
jgi:hypothetical protein